MPMYNPEPPSVVAGRPFLYDARRSSSHGDSSCGSCHIFGDLDSTTWDLGDPDGTLLNNPGPFVPVPPEFGNDPLFGVARGFPPTEGTDGDPEPARHGQPRTDALARRPHRWQ